MKTPSTPTSFKSIVDLVADRLVELLTAYCQTSLVGIPEAEPFLAGLVRKGVLQEPRTKYRIALLVSPSNPDSQSDKPPEASAPSRWLADNDLGGFDQSDELGGGEFWEHTFTVSIEVALQKTNEDRPTAMQIGLWVFGRAAQAIRENKELGLTDDFGETAYFMKTRNVNPVEGGGPPRDFSWSGKLFVTAYTSAPGGLG